MAVFRGIRFPFGKNTTAFPAPTEDAELVNESIRQIVLTTKGERVMRPGFGSSAHAFVFENNNNILSELIQDELSTAIAKFEPRAIVQRIEVERRDSEVLVSITYVVALTGVQKTLTISLTTNM